MPVVCILPELLATAGLTSRCSTAHSLTSGPIHFKGRMMVVVKGIVFLRDGWEIGKVEMVDSVAPLSPSSHVFGPGVSFALGSP